jgi:hypothetical protein
MGMGLASALCLLPTQLAITFGRYDLDAVLAVHDGGRRPTLVGMAEVESSCPPHEVGPLPGLRL